MLKNVSTSERPGSLSKEKQIRIKIDLPAESRGDHHDIYICHKEEKLV